MVSNVRNKKYTRDGTRSDHAKSMLMHVISHDHDEPGHEKNGAKPVERSVEMWKERKKIH